MVCQKFSLERFVEWKEELFTDANVGFVIGELEQVGAGLIRVFNFKLPEICDRAKT